MEKEKTHYRINITQTLLMLGAAGVLDLVSTIPFLNIVVSFFATMTFGLWFYNLDFGLVNFRRLVAPIIAIIIEIVPALSILPAIFFAVLINIILSWIEDKTGIGVTKLLSKAKGGLGGAAGAAAEGGEIASTINSVTTK